MEITFNENHLQELKENKPRLDLFLAQNTEYNRNFLQNLIKSQNIKVNNQKTKCGYLLRLGDKINITIPPLEPINLEPTNIPLDIIYEDEHLAVINKPINMVVHPAKGHYNNTLVNALLFHFPCLKKPDHTKNICYQERLGIVHRLDKDTEGLLVIAKNYQVLTNLQNQFKDRNVIKKYYALVQGVLPRDEYEINLPIGRDPKNRLKYKVITEAMQNVNSNKKLKAKSALSYVKIIKRGTNTCLVEVEIKTGRTHQIRVHLAHIGYPIINDLLYNKKTKKGAQLLQAFYLSFKHPITNKISTFELPLSERIKQKNT